MNRHTNRREFLKSSALAGAGFWVAGTCARAESRSPSERLNIGIIGVHSRGAANMEAVASENIVALCDVDENYLAEAAKKYPQAEDLRRLAQDARPEGRRRGHREHDGAHPRPGQRHGHEARQARVLREAAWPTRCTRPA